MEQTLIEGPSSQMQADFVRYLVDMGCSGAKAAELAGYKGGKQAAYHLLRLPHIQKALRDARAVLWSGELASKAQGVIRTILTMEGEGAPAFKVKLDAAKFVLTMAGDAKSKDGGGLTDKPLGQMSKAELDDYLDKAQAVLDAHRPVITINAQEPGITEPEPLEEPSVDTP